MSDQPAPNPVQEVAKAVEQGVKQEQQSGGFLSSLQLIWQAVATILPVLFVSLFDYEETKIDRLKREKEGLQLTIDKMENQNAIDKKYAGMSDADIVLSAGNSGPGDAKPKG